MMTGVGGDIAQPHWGLHLGLIAQAQWGLRLGLGSHLAHQTLMTGGGILHLIVDWGWFLPRWILDMAVHP